MASKSARPGPRAEERAPAVEAYLEKLPPEMRSSLERVRATVRRAAPGAQEVISYKIPAFRYEGRILVWYAGFSKHASFFPGSLERLDSLAAEMRPFVAAKGTLRFTPDHPLPPRLISRIVKARIAQNRRIGKSSPSGHSQKRP
jgi:uncharacterized protein YdhG (YjbR/CyaY superfamily)